MSMNHQIYFSTIARLLAEGKKFATVQAVEVKGSYPQHQGAKMIVSTESETSPLFGTIGGGNVEKTAIKHAYDLLQKAQNAPAQSLQTQDMVRWNLAKELKMTCGGEVTLFFELFGFHTFQIAIFGAGHVAQSLVPLLLTATDCMVYVIDTREEWLQKFSSHSQLKTLKCSSFAEGVDLIPQDAFAISMTPGHLFDKEVLTALLKKGTYPYIGAIGSQAKARDLKQFLVQQGFAEKQVEKIFCPIGLPLGGNTPGEVAISIIAQLLAERDRVYDA